MAFPKAQQVRWACQKKPNPGRDGITTVKGIFGLPRWTVGSVRGTMTSRNSMIDPGHPCGRIIGKAFSGFDRT